MYIRIEKYTLETIIGWVTFFVLKWAVVGHSATTSAPKQARSSNVFGDTIKRSDENEMHFAKGVKRGATTQTRIVVVDWRFIQNKEQNQNKSTYTQRRKTGFRHLNAI